MPHGGSLAGRAGDADPGDRYQTGPHSRHKTGKPVVSTIRNLLLRSDIGQWVVWDGAAYGQTNPQLTDKRGSFKVFLVPGRKVCLRASGQWIYHTRR